MSAERRAQHFNDQRHNEALKTDQERVFSSAIEWYRETVRFMKLDVDALVWDDLSDHERALYRAVEKYEQRKAGRR